MGAKILNGKEVSERIKSGLKDKVTELKKNGIFPGLAVVLVGNDPASRVYVNSKKKACEFIGIESFEYTLPEDTTEKQLLELVTKLNEDKRVDGILVQLPLPKHINEENVINAISPSKDVDAFHPVNTGRLMTGNPLFLPCTPAGVMELIHESGIDVKGKECVVAGRSNIVGKPVALMLLQKHATVTIAHSRTKNLDKIAQSADILVVAIGKPGFIDSSFVKKGAVVIDVGTTRVNGSLKGDVIFEEVREKAGYITPVPGGVGPMTITMLMENTLIAAKRSL